MICRLVVQSLCVIKINRVVFYKTGYLNDYFEKELILDNITNPNKPFCYFYYAVLIIYGLNVFFTALYSLEKINGLYKK